jgi:hypothetical protein
MFSADDRMGLARVFRIAVGLAAVAAAGAILTGRGLVYDGAYYLLGVASHERFQLYEPARLTVQVLQQCFAVAGARLGIHDLWALGVLFSLGVAGWPVVLTTLCWFVLPRDDKSWIAGPLLNLVFAIPATIFAGIGEGVIASCLLWLAFLLIEFRSRNTPGALACIVATAACAFSHESALLCLLVIASAALLRLSDTKGFGRAAMFLVAAVALAGAGNMGRWILFPRSAVERGDFLASMGGFLGWPSDPNIPAVASVIAGLAVLAALAAKGKRAWTAAYIAVGLIAILLVVFVVGADRVIVPSRFFAARGLPVALTTLLAAFFLVLRRRGETPARFATPPVLAIVLCLAIVQPVAQAFITERWASYVEALRGLVSTENGVVPHALAMRRLDPQGSRFRRELLETWSMEPLAVLLAPQGRVRAFVEASPRERWVPYDPHNPGKLPRAPGLDWSNFVPHPAQ